ncbi:unnamed protein product, partial [Laminaria digitata]
TRPAASYTNGPNGRPSTDQSVGWPATARALVPSSASSPLSKSLTEAAVAAHDEPPSPTPTTSAAAAEFEPVRPRSQRIPFPVRFATTTGGSHSTDKLSIVTPPKPVVAPTL